MKERPALSLSFSLPSTYWDFFLYGRANQNDQPRNLIRLFSCFQLELERITRSQSMQKRNKKTRERHPKLTSGPYWLTTTLSSLSWLDRLGNQQKTRGAIVPTLACFRPGIEANSSQECVCIHRTLARYYPVLCGGNQLGCGHGGPLFSFLFSLNRNRWMCNINWDRWFWKRRHPYFYIVFVLIFSLDREPTPSHLLSQQ